MTVQCSENFTVTDGSEEIFHNE